MSRYPSTQVCFVRPSIHRLTRLLTTTQLSRYQLRWLAKSITEWGAGMPQVVIAWHGLARTGRDMDPLAAHLASRYRVICPDTLGRGLSQWARAAGRVPPVVSTRASRPTLFDQLGVENPLGTSMGGAIGTPCASGLFEPQPAGRIQSPLLNRTTPRAYADAALGTHQGLQAIRPAFDNTGWELEAFSDRYTRPMAGFSMSSGACSLRAAPLPA